MWIAFWCKHFPGNYWHITRLCISVRPWLATEATATAYRWDIRDENKEVQGVRLKIRSNPSIWSAAQQQHSADVQSGVLLLMWSNWDWEPTIPIKVNSEILWWQQRAPPTHPPLDPLQSSMGATCSRWHPERANVDGYVWGELLISWIGKESRQKCALVGLHLGGWVTNCASLFYHISWPTMRHQTIPKSS